MVALVSINFSCVGTFLSTSPNHDLCTSDDSSMKSVQVTSVLPTTASSAFVPVMPSTVSSTFVVPSLDPFVSASLVGRHRTHPTPDQTSSPKLKGLAVNVAGDSNLRKIGKYNIL